VKEDHAGGEALGQLDALLVGHLAQKRLWQLQQQSATVAGLAVRGDRTTVGQSAQGIECITQNLVAGLVVKLGNQPEAAGITFKIRVMQSFQSGARWSWVGGWSCG
jgi:hypothetical protein